MGNPTKKLPLIERDDWLLPVERELTARYESYLQALGEIEKSAGSIVDYANGYRYFGWQRDEALEGWWFREWLPGAQDVYLLGDFNGWQRTSLKPIKNNKNSFCKAAVNISSCKHSLIALKKDTSVFG